MACLLSVAVGCGAAEDPATVRLKPGTECVVRVPGWANANEPQRLGTPLQEASVPDEGFPPLIVAGTVAKVASDENPTVMEAGTPPDTDGVVDSRMVQVQILDGKYKGASGLLPRNELRAVK